VNHVTERVDCCCLGARVRLEAMAALVSTGAWVSLGVRGRPDGLLGGLSIAGEPRGAGVAFIISELSGGRAEAPWVFRWTVGAYGWQQSAN
jgi:hypothetical protein